MIGDQSAADSTSQSLVDGRIEQIIDMEDAEVLPDLRVHNSGQVTKFDCLKSAKVSSMRILVLL